MGESEQIGWDRTYCYLESNTLKNKLNIYDLDELHNAERDITSNRLASLYKEPIQGSFDVKHLKKIHKHLFRSLYDWAGKFRSVDIAKGNLFCKVEFIAEASEKVFRKLQEENYCIGLPEDKSFSRLAYYMGEINAVHPFREGNGRTQRVLIENLAIISGYEINFGKISKERMLEASVQSFQCNYQPLETLLRDSASKVTYEVQFNTALKIVPADSRPAQVMADYKGYIREIQSKLAEAGYRPTDKLVRNVEKIDHKFGKKHSMKEIQQYTKNIVQLSKDEKQLVQTVAEAFKAQERKRESKNIPHMEL